MAEAPFTRSRSLERLLAESLSLSRDGLARQRPVVRAPSVESAPLTTRLATIRQAAMRTAASANTTSDAAMIAGLRLAVALAAVPSGERRRFARWPLATAGRLDLDGQMVAAQTLDIGRGGVMLAPVAGLFPGDNRQARLDLAPIDIAVACSLTVDRAGVIHLAFDQPVPNHPDEISRLEQHCEAFYEVAFWEASALANEAQACLEAAVSTEAISLDDAFPRGGVTSQALGKLERDLAALLERLPQTPSLAYACLTARDGFVLVERIDAGATRSRRQLRPADAVTFRAAAFASSPIVQTYRRLPGQEPEQVFSDVSAPVILRGRRWGCVQIGRRLATPNEV